MEKRKDTLSTIKLCRFCLSRDESIRSLYDRSREAKKSVSLSLKILSCLSVEIFPSDKMPMYICNRCKFFMDLCYEYKQLCRRADESTLQYVQSGTALEPIVWPPSLVKMFRYGARPTSEVVKTVVEGGATVEVTSQEVFDSDDGEENVYNVKIGDGPDEGSACVKIVTSKNNKNTKKTSKKADKGFSSVSKLTRHVRSHAGERAYPCKYCNKSFIKSHHYTRHLRLKHREMHHRISEPEDRDQYRCEQCEDTFGTQDDLIYHSAIHATQNLTCPLCQEKFENVDAVTVHIKSHVNGIEFMCDFCELVFTSREKLDTHVSVAHEEELHQPELGQNESSMEMDVEDDEDDNTINLKEEDGHMVVEIKKADEFMITNSQIDSEEKVDNTNSEESESETTYMELSTVDPLAIIKKESPIKAVPERAANSIVTITPKTAMIRTEKSNESQTVSILQKAEEIKRKAIQQQSSDSSSLAQAKKEKLNKVESSSSIGASDKSLRLLEKELQELKRTTARNEVLKTPIKTAESLRSSRRPQLHTSTPKLRPTDDKKSQPSPKAVATDKKLPERRAVKENKEPKDMKETKPSNGGKEEKETKVSSGVAREEKEKESKENETPKSFIKNCATDKSGAEEGVRRSTRPSKIKDYAKMIRDRSQAPSDDDSEDDDEEYVEAEKLPENRTKTRRVNVKPQPKITKPAVVATPVARKRGRPRKEHPAEVLPKIKKDTNDDDEESKFETTESEENIKTKSNPVSDNKLDNEAKSSTDESSSADDKPVNTEQKPQDGTLVSPTGQTLKKVPIKQLPPGVKPLPLPVNARPMGPGELCEMQIGKKVVKVQKIVMTKAEVEAMAKKGLVEMKDGTMVLKQGIKIPTSDPLVIKSTLVGEDVGKDSPSKKDKATPTRCDFGEDA